MASKKPAPKKAPAKKVVNVAPKKGAKASVVSKTAKAAPKKVAKAPAGSKVVKAAPTKVAKAPISKTKSSPEKKVVKPALKKEVAKKVAPKPVKTPAKPAAKSKTANSVATAKGVKKAKPATKAPAKKAVVTPKKVVKPAPKPAPKKATPKPEKKKVERTPVVKNAAKAPKKEAPKKIIVAPISTNVPKKIDAFKTNTFATSNLKNESGKVIAHRKTSELKRKTEDPKPKKYIPELSRSILDMSQNTNTTSYRYSDEDLMEFKDLIQRKLDTAKAELQYLQGVIMRRDESGTEDTENKYQNMEDGSASMDREQLNQLASRQVTFITHLEQALVRIENKTYGICRETGKLIDKARLRAVPHATLSIEAKNAKKN